jgi:MoxR-like ATPase
MFTGPAGCGKSVGPEQLAAIQNRPYYCVSFHEDFREAEFFGENRAANGLIEWFDGEGIKAWSTPGSTILLDEVDRAEPGVLSKLHRYLNGATVEMTFPAKNGETITVKRSNGLQIVGATNGMGDSEQGMVYNSTKQMDGAFRSRWSMFEKIGYADPKIEKGLILKKLREKFDNVDTMLKKGLNNKLESIIKAANTARLDAEKHCKQLVISYRSTIKCAELMCFYNMDTTLAVHQSIINTIDEQEAQEVDTFFHSHLGDDYTRKYTASDDT